MIAMIDSLFALIAFGSLWFWILTSILSIVIVACIENEKYVFPTFLLSLFLAIYWKAIAACVFGWQTIAICILIYTVVGIGWSMFRWYRYTFKTVADFNNGSVSNYELPNRLNVRQNKSLIVSWIAYWPWSMVWNITGDFFTMIYESMSKVFENISQSAMKGAKIDEKKK